MIDQLIAALKRQIDSDNYLKLDREQTRALLFLLEDLRDVRDIQFAVSDLLGVLPDGPKEHAG